MAINELRSISTFIKAAELGSLRKAAHALSISPQAASKALAQLEEHLDARLFHRTTRVMSLTDAGQRLLEDVHPALLGMQRALRNARTARDEFVGPAHRRATHNLPAHPLALGRRVLRAAPGRVFSPTCPG